MNQPPTDQQINHPDQSSELVHVEYEHWRNLAGSASRQQYFASWLAIMATSIGDVVSASVLSMRDDVLSPAGLWPDDSAEIGPAALLLAGESFRSGEPLIDRIDIVVDGDNGDEHIILAYPLVLDDGVAAMVAMRLVDRDDDALTAVLQQIQLGSAWLELLFRREESDSDQALVDQAISTLGLMTRVAAQNDARDAATELVTSLSAALDCERVMYGASKRNDITLLALSNSGQFGRKMNLVNLVGEAMLEAIDQESAIRLPADDSALSGLAVTRHKRLMEESRCGAVMTIPVKRNERWLGAVLLERGTNAKNFSSEEYDLVETTVSIAAAMIADKQLAERSVLAIIGSRCGRFFKDTIHIKYPLRTAVIAGLAALIATGLLVKDEFEVKGRARLEGLIERAVVAPFDGYIELSERRIGDQVREGELLGKMDASDLELEQIDLASKRAQALNQIRESQASGNRAQVNILQTQLSQVDAQIALLEARIARTVLTAPYDGYVVSGDLSRQLGAATSRGDVLFVIAPLTEYRVVVQVDERDIAWVREGSAARLVLSARPSDVIDLEVTSITPVAAAAGGSNSFRVEAELTDTDRALRPGMEGVARIQSGQRSLMWIWTREFMDWLRVTTWRWLP